MLKKTTALTLIGVIMLISNLFAQTPQEKKKIKVQMFINGQLHPTNQTLTKADKDIQLKAFDAQTNRELAITLMNATLVRNGQKIMSISLPGNGSIERLIAKAKNNDNYVFEIKQIMELADDLSLRPFSDKTFKVTYWFFDAELDANKVAVGSN